MSNNKEISDALRSAKRAADNFASPMISGNPSNPKDVGIALNHIIKAIELLAEEADRVAGSVSALEIQPPTAQQS